jgi:hypothetical protein
MGLPTNIIVTKYTPGGEFVNMLTNAAYQGYYYEYNNRTFAGNQYSVNAPEIVRINSQNHNKLYNNTQTAIYSVSSGIKSKDITTPPVASLPFSGIDPTISTKFFYKKYNDNIIKETNEDGYKTLQKNPIYQTTFVGTYNGKTQTIDQANLQVPDLKAFLEA